jgi:hypothetical protein
MLRLEDCFDICGLSKDEIRYFVEREHISELQVAELAERYVVVDDTGVPRLRRTIVQDIEDLKGLLRLKEARILEDFVRDFVGSHPHTERQRRSA